LLELVLNARILVSEYTPELTWNPQSPLATIHGRASRERQFDEWCDQIVAVGSIDDQYPEKQSNGYEKKDSVKNGNLFP